MIQLRAWNPKSKKMHYFDLGQSFHDGFVARHICLLLADEHPNGKGLMMQATGLTDNMGSDIWYGDVYYVAGYGAFCVDGVRDIPALIKAIDKNHLGDCLGDVFNSPEYLEEKS
tara:strand:+ start:49042 stop:49383 length:342 start_codon:yes stop_codon:yes gene_type:complete